jgi:hypothetical protein
MADVSEKMRSNRKVAIPGIAAATIAAVIGAVFGALWLMALSGTISSLTLTTSHPMLMLYGFVYGFVLSVASLLVPRFRNADPSRHTKLRLLSVIAVVAGAIARSLSGQGTPISTAALIVSAAGAASMAFYVFKTIGLPRGPLGASDPLLQHSVAVMVLVLVLHAFLERSGAAPFTTPGFLNLSLFGAVGSMVLAVGIKTVHFRVDLRLRRGIWWWISPLQVIGSTLSVAAVLSGDRVVELLGTVFFAAALLLWVHSVDALRVVRSGVQYSRMNERDRKRYEYFAVHFVIAVLWGLSSSVFSVLYSLSSMTSGALWYGFRDAAIHSFTVGFVGNMILAYAPIMLPGLLTGKTPYIGLSFWPAAYLNLGNALRTAWFLTGIGGPAVPVLASALYLSSIAHALHMMHSLR